MLFRDDNRRLFSKVGNLQNLLSAFSFDHPKFLFALHPLRLYQHKYPAQESNGEKETVSVYVRLGLCVSSS
jgi:hypothetical protein